METNPEVNTWFTELDHPLKPAMLRVRETILTADARMSEMVQYGTVHFVYGSPLCSFVQVKDHKRVSLMFNAAGRLKGDFPHLEGKSVRYMRFTSVAEADARSAELRRIVAAWIAYKSPSPSGRGSG